MEDLSAEQVIELLGLQPHPEGGFFAETYRDETGADARAFSTAIYFLLPEGIESAWHRVDAAEVWHWYAGAPLILSLAGEGIDSRSMVLGSNLMKDERPQGVVPPHAWQKAKSLGAWTLVGCTVAPGFEFSTFELAEPGFEPS